MQNQESVRQGAYDIWEKDGQPDDHHDEHWAQACRDIEAEDGAANTRSVAS